MDDKKVNLQGLPQKSSDLFSLFRVYYLTHNFNDIIKALCKTSPTFTLITNNHKFKCHIEIAATVSGKIFNALKSNPNLKEFMLNDDFDDSNFNQIIDFLNGTPLKITDSNREYITYIIQTLEVNQSKVHIDTQRELKLNQFSRDFYNTILNVKNHITFTNSKNEKYLVNYLLASAYCKILKGEEKLDPKQININLNTSDDLSDIADFLNGNNLKINFDNFDKIKEIFSQLQITSLDLILKQIDLSFELLKPIISTINLQDTILDMNESKTNQNYELLKSSEYFINPKMHYELLLALEISFSYRPRHYQSVIDLFSLLHSNSETLHESLISYLSERYKLSILSIPFLRSIYDIHIISLDEVLKILNEDLYKIENMHDTRQLETKTLLFFAFELYDNNKDKFLKRVKANEIYSADVKQILDYIEKREEYSKLIHLYHRPDDLCAAIYNDDADLLQEISSRQPNFDYNQILKPFLFEPFEEINCNVTLANLAAFYGSVRCFRYLKLQHSDLSSSGKFAIFGGNNEIVRLIEQDGNKLNDLFYCAIQYHRYDLFKWLCFNHGPIGELYKEEYRQGKQPLIPLSIKSYNYRAFIYFYEKGIKPVVNRYEISLLGNALSTLNLHALKLLCLTYQVNVNNLTINNIPPIFYASSFNSLDEVKILIEFGKCEIPKENYKNPLFVAAKKGYIEIVEYLLPFYKDVIDDKYFDHLLKLDIDPKIREILLSAQK